MNNFVNNKYTHNGNRDQKEMDCWKIAAISTGAYLDRTISVVKLTFGSDLPGLSPLFLIVSCCHNDQRAILDQPESFEQATNVETLVKRPCKFEQAAIPDCVLPHLAIAEHR